mgnify:CR=1 FL=1
MIRTKGINHIALVCRDMKETVQFYTEVLNMPLFKTVELPGGGQHFFFDCGGGAAVAFFWGGIPLQILFREQGLLAAEWLLLFVPAVAFVVMGGFDPVRTLSLKRPTPPQALASVLVIFGAMPLVWAHAEYVKLLRSLRDGQVFDMPPQGVQRP